ncbi:hypothetical protein SDC9_188904 [bioreactor metagenome]|uniref:Uncharacterized protein n=1 Tax=bioreactor metagenome TaxID=1076179 RepID=A0A645HT27_9ZZZZ
MQQRQGDGRAALFAGAAACSGIRQALRFVTHNGGNGFGIRNAGDGISRLTAFLCPLSHGLGNRTVDKGAILQMLPLQLIQLRQREKGGLRLASSRVMQGIRLTTGINEGPSAQTPHPC